MNDTNYCMSSLDSTEPLRQLLEQYRVSNRTQKLDILNEVQDHVYERYLRKKGNEDAIADSLLKILQDESDLEIIEEIMDALFNLTEGMYLPNARWGVLIERFPDLKTSEQKEFALSLLAQSLDLQFITFLQKFIHNSNSDVAQAALESIEEIECNDAKNKLAGKLGFALQPLVSNQNENAIRRELCKELLSIFNFELQFGNTIERIDRKKWDNADLVIVFQKPLFYEQSELHLRLSEKITFTQFSVPHYSAESTYYVKECRQAISGPLREK